MKVKEKFKNIIKRFKKAFEKFPTTMITIVFTTLFCAIFLDTKVSKEKIFTYILEFCLIFAVGSFFIEAYGKAKTKLKIIIYFVSGLIAGTFVFFINKNLTSNQEFNLARILISYIVILITLALYFLYKNSKKSIEEYSIKVFSNLVKTGLIYFVLSIGISMITAVFIYLILPDSFSYNLIWRLEIILFGIYFVPNVIYNFTNVEDEVAIFFKGFIKYVLGGLVFAAFVIIYMYMVKIFVLWNIPSNQIFRILTVLFILSLPVWTMIHYYNDSENNLWQKIYKKMPLLFTPFVLLQIYSMGTRIASNGFTPIRYVGIIFIIFEILYLLLYFFKKEKLENIIFIFDILFIICALVPAINMFSVSNISQANRLKIYTQKTELESKEKEQVYGAFNYLSNSKNGEKYINKILNKEQIAKIKEDLPYLNYNSYENNLRYIYASADWDTIDVENYSKVYKVSSSVSLNKSVDEAFENLNIYEGKTINLRNAVLDYIYEYERNENNFRTYFEGHNKVALEDESKLIIECFNVSYEQDTKQIKYYDINGILLSK